MTAIEDKVSASILRIRGGLPFFGTLALFLEHRLDPSIPTAATDGHSVFFNPQFINSLSREELDAVMVHELLHAALLHVTRRKDRDPLIWNIAADIVVNGIIRSESALRLPKDAHIDPTLEKHEVEEVYDCLTKSHEKRVIRWLSGDLLPTFSKQSPTSFKGTNAASIRNRSQKTLEAHWRQALREASIIATASGRGGIPAHIRLRVEAVTQSQIDWRSVLWRFLVQTPVDFTDFDRRFVGMGIYVDSLSGENISARIAVDTSGSVDAEMLAHFTAEVLEVTRIYPHINANLYFADAALHGPFPLEKHYLNRPIGGGGTSFVPFFNAMRSEVSCAAKENILIYLTDGFGTFPESKPDQPVLWVVPSGGLPSAKFPFGTVARFISER